MGGQALWLWNMHQPSEKTEKTLIEENPISSHSGDILSDFFRLGSLSNHTGVMSSFEEMQKRMDLIMQESLSSSSLLSSSFLTGIEPEIEMNETSDLYKIKVKVPEGNDVSLQTEIKEGILHISGTVIQEETQSSNQNFSSMTSSSQFTRALTLSNHVDPASISMEEMKDGVIIKIPKSNG